jgi:hypothetical protein
MGCIVIIDKQEKVLLQTSFAKPPKPYVSKILKYAEGWSYKHFDDEEIIDFFDKNPIPGFENISLRFLNLTRGEHKADLFRYYYLYINGGFYMDTDVELVASVDDIIGGYSFVASQLNYNESKNSRSSIFNGLMFAKKNSPIMLQALSHAYHADLDYLNSGNSYFVICEALHSLVYSNINTEMVKLYRAIDDPVSKTGFVLDDKKTLAIHHYSKNFYF